MRSSYSPAVGAFLSLVTACGMSAWLNAQPATGTDALLKRIQALERRVEDLEKLRGAFTAGGGNDPAAPGGTSTSPTMPRPTAPPPGPGVDTALTGTVTRFKAPLEIVGADGRPILQIKEKRANQAGLFLFNAIGKEVASIQTFGNGNGSLVARSGASNVDAMLVGAPEGGALVLDDERGEVFVRLDGGERGLSLFNTAGNVTVELKTTGTGRLTLSDAAGNITVQAGTTEGGLGVVRAGPVMGGPIGNTGLLPYAIMGRKR